MTVQTYQIYINSLSTENIMYTLYYSPSACSLATQVILHELNQAVEIINVQQLDNFKSINPVGAVPVLIDQAQNQTYTEGAAIILHLLKRHENTLLPLTGNAHQQGLENLMFANATMHPAYSRLFFIAQHISDERVKQVAFDKAADSINHLWQVVEQKLARQKSGTALETTYLGGEKPSAGDILLAVYSRWGASFPVKITLGPNAQKMTEAVFAMPSFIKALANEQN
jgi:glutathione S-transferase